MVMLYLWWPDCWLVGDLRQVSWTGAEVAIGMFHSIGRPKWGFPHGLGSVCDCSTTHCCCCCHFPGCPWSSCVPGSYAWVWSDVLLLNHAPESPPKDNNKKRFNPNIGHWNKCKNQQQFKFKINKENCNRSCARLRLCLPVMNCCLNPGSPLWMQLPFYLRMVKENMQWCINIKFYRKKCCLALKTHELLL